MWKSANRKFKVQEYPTEFERVGNNEEAKFLRYNEKKSSTTKTTKYSNLKFVKIQILLSSSQ